MDGCMKSTMHFNYVCGSKKINTQVLLYDGHDSHFEEKAIQILRSDHIKPFVLKVGDPRNDQKNDNGPSLKQKGMYGKY